MSIRDSSINTSRSKLKIKDKEEEDGITLQNSFQRLNFKRLLDKKQSNLEYWQKKADRKIVFKVDNSYTHLIDSLLKAGWVQSTKTDISGADFIYGKDTFNLEYHPNLKPDQ